jgi:hypothetical protein
MISSGISSQDGRSVRIFNGHTTASRMSCCSFDRRAMRTKISTSSRSFYRLLHQSILVSGRKRGTHREGKLAQVQTSKPFIASSSDWLPALQDAIIAPFLELKLVSCFSWLVRQICEMLAKSGRDPRRSRWLLCNALVGIRRISIFSYGPSLGMLGPGGPYKEQSSVTWETTYPTYPLSLWLIRSLLNHHDPSSRSPLDPLDQLRCGAHDLQGTSPPREVPLHDGS